MKAFVDTFGAGATAGPLDALAKQLASHVGDSEFMVSHVLRFTLFSWTEAQAVSRACCANPLTVTLADYQAWISRFGTESDEVAYVSAKSLFTVKGNDVQLLPWYYGLSSPSAGTAQATLAGKAPGSFLVRISGSTAGAFAFSYTIASGEIRHTRVHRAPGGYLCDGRTTLSPTLPDLVKTLGGALITPVPSTLSQASLATLPAVAAASPLAAEDASSAYASYNEISTPSVALPAAATVSSPTPVASPASSSTPGAAKEAVVPTKAFDVMISYNWSSQPLVLRLKQELDKLGLATWLDLSHMSQTYLSDMVSAVHNARCVILCVSEKYLKSENCLTEVNLVCELRSIKPYIIAVLEKDLVPSRLNHPIAVLAAVSINPVSTS